MRTGLVGIWCWRRAEEHQRTSVLDRLSCNRLLFIHANTSSTQSDTLLQKGRRPRKVDRTRRSGCRQHTRADEADGAWPVAASRQRTVEKVSVRAPILEELRAQQPVAPTRSMTSSRTVYGHSNRKQSSRRQPLQGRRTFVIGVWLRKSDYKTWLEYCET